MKLFSKRKKDAPPKSKPIKEKVLKGKLEKDISDEDISSGRAVKKKRRLIVLTPSSVVLAAYLLLILTQFIEITLINRENEYFSVVILQLMIFLVPGAVWCMWNGESYIKGLRLKMFKPNSILLIISAAVLMVSGGLLLSSLFGGLDSLSKNFSLYDTFVSKSDGSIPSYLYLLAAYAIIPAITEEFIFRGILCLEYEKGGVLRAVLLSSAFFTMLHFNPINMVNYFFSGVILALVLYASRSLFGAMLAHFLYNLFGLFGQPYMNTLYHITGSSSFFIFLIAFAFLLSGAVFCQQAARLYKKYLYDGEPSSYRFPILTKPADFKFAYLSVLKEPSTIACILVYILASVIYLVRS